MDEPKIINFSKIETKWQKRWELEKAFEVNEKSKKPKYYCLEQYSYPSGAGLHMGHALIYTIGDIYARLKRMQGYNVLHPVGFDSFGLPAENAAIKAKSHPKKFTDEAIKNFTAQLKRLGISYDWSRLIYSHNPRVYKWDQWIFLKMLEKGLAYKKEAPVNWCNKCNTVLANEQVENGKCYLHSNVDVEVKHLNQWYLKTTNYTKELLEELDNLDGWPDTVKRLQRNWIGKSEGAEIVFNVDGSKWSIFTTRPDTLFGVTFLVVSAQHSKLSKLITKNQRKEVDKFLKKTKSVKERDIVTLEKEGVFTGSYATHPLTNEKIPIWTGNFVLPDYGSGMVMAVPAHDKRDFEFAKKYKLPIKQVITAPNYPKVLKEAYIYPGKLINSEGFTDLSSREAKEHIVRALELKKLGKKKIQYRLRDWCVSRQRFWGTPIPIINCEKCGSVPVPESDLPIKLPDNIKMNSKINPLTTYKPFLETTCPKCNSKATRETDTMDTFANSSWYFLRFCDPNNNKEIFNSKKVDYWMNIDMYIGGIEHANLHDIYFRFYTKFLSDLGLLKVREPAKALFNQGFINGSDGRKMSKSLGNVINPDTTADKFGVDATRMFIVSVAAPDKGFNWDEKGIEGSQKFIKKLYDYFDTIKFDKSSPKVEHKINKAIKEITKEIEKFNYNIAVIKIRTLFDSIQNETISKENIESYLKLLSLFCPHIAEEFWEKIGNKSLISLSNWPESDESKINDDIDKQEKTLEKTIKDIQNILKLVKTKPKHVYIYTIPPEVKNYDSKLLSEKSGLQVSVFAINDKDKYDPENKAIRAKHSKPAIYVE